MSSCPYDGVVVVPVPPFVTLNTPLTSFEPRPIDEVLMMPFVAFKNPLSVLSVKLLAKRFVIVPVAAASVPIPRSPIEPLVA